MNILYNPYWCILGIVVFFIVSTVIFRIDYININKIIKSYFNDLKNENGNIPIMVIILYLICPLVIAWCCSNIKIINNEITGNITVMLSIITAMLFTLLPLLIDLKSKIGDRLQSNGSKRREFLALLSETFNSIMFVIIISIGLLLMIFLFSFIQVKNRIISTAIYYLLFIFLLNLLIVLKRFFIIFKEGLND